MAVVELESLTKRFGDAAALDGLTLTIEHGSLVCLLGPSGCGKTTTLRLVAGFIDPDQGTIRVGGRTVSEPGRSLPPERRRMSMIFQSYALWPRMTIAGNVEYGLKLRRMDRAERERRVNSILDVAHLTELAERYPHELSGGQRQRVNIARAIATNPAFVVLDEPTSALDVSLRSRIILLLESLRERLGLSYLFISHDIATVKYLAHRVAVMYLGVIVELADTAELFARPLHPYTRALLSAVPVPEPGVSRRGRFALSGEIPSALNIPTGCRLRGRCPLAQQVCATPVPLRELAPRHWVACHFA